MNLDLIWSSLPDLLDGARLTVLLSAQSIVLGLLLAVPIALMRLSPKAVLWMPAYGFIFFIRGTPLLVQIFLIYYGSAQFRNVLETCGLWAFFRDAYFCAILSLTINTAGYTAEILRGGILAVPYGEIEAARALGMSVRTTYLRIILPKAFRIMLPAYSNEVVFMIQGTSLVSIITLMDLTGVARVIIARSYATYEIFIAIALIYLALCYGILWGFKKVEHRLNAHLRELPDAGLYLGEPLAPTTVDR